MELFDEEMMRDNHFKWISHFVLF